MSSWWVANTSTAHMFKLEFAPTATPVDPRSFAPLCITNYKPSSIIEKMSMSLLFRGRIQMNATKSTCPLRNGPSTHTSDVH